jgi:hypothetical protein
VFRLVVILLVLLQGGVEINIKFIQAADFYLRMVSGVRCLDNMILNLLLRSHGECDAFSRDQKLCQDPPIEDDAKIKA